MHCTGGECPPFVTFGTAWSAQLLYTSGRIWARRRGPKPGSRQGQPVSSPRASEKYRELLMTLGVIFLIAAAMYFLVPADSLPTFFPGHETGLMRIRAKHGMLTGAVGIVLLAASWFMGRR